MELSTQLIDEMSLGERIRNAFAASGGGMTMREFARYCFEAGVYSEDDLAEFSILAAMQVNRKELKVMDTGGLPFAGPTTSRDSGGNPVWEQRAFWDPETYVANITDLRTRAATMTVTASKLQDEGEERFGALPFEATVEEHVT